MVPDVQAHMTTFGVLPLILFYMALFIVIRTHKPWVERRERRTFLVIGGTWAVTVFIANYLLYRAGLMSYLPWLNNFLHTFAWIGVCLTFLYLGLRESQPMIVQFIAFATFSLIVKYAEHLLLGTWEHDHFFHAFRGNTAYILGWSLADGLYPPLTLYGLRILAKRIPGLIAL
jgi:ABC-type transport system involved in cytochrome c biogenesis permease subunit